MLTHRPAMRFCVPLIMGILAGYSYSLPLSLMWWAVGLFGVLYALSYILKCKSLKRWRSILTFMSIFVIGIARISVDGTYFERQSIGSFIDPKRDVCIKGSLSDEPVVTSRSLRLVIDVDSVVAGKKLFLTFGGMIVSFPRSRCDPRFIDSLSQGRHMTLKGRITSLPRARNPGEPDLRTYYHLNEIYAQMNPPAIDSCSFGRQNRSIFQTYVLFVRKEISHRIDSLIGGSAGNFLKGLIVGERTEVPAEVKTAFINSGVMHILAVSGLHVAIVAFILLTLFRILRLPETLCTLLTILALVYYMFLTGAAASVARSVFMAAIVLGAKMLQLKSDMYNTLAVSAIIILCVDTKQLLQPGFQLSYVAVFSLVYLYPKVYDLKRLLPSIVRDHKFVIPLFAALSVSVAAGLGTLPFTSFYFGKISIDGFLTNIIAVPLSNVILAIGMLTVAVSFLSMWCASIYASATWFLTITLLKIVDWFGTRSYAYVASQFGIPGALLFYGTLAVIIHIRSAHYRKFALIALLVLANWTLYNEVVRSSSTPQLHITVLDVGQGDAIIIEFPFGKTFLIDGGPMTPTRDSGEKVILPYLKWKRIDHLDGIILSHPHSDHLGGILSVLKTVRVDCVYDGGSDTASALHKDYFHLIDSLRIRRIIVHACDTIGGIRGVRLYVLHPQKTLMAKAHAEHRINLNNQSVVVKLCYGRTSMLFEGDAELEAEESMSSMFRAFVHSDILKAAHHGSSTSSDERFLELVRPERALISVGVNNKFHHPSPRVLSRYSADGISYERTDEEGAITMVSDGASWRKVEWRDP